MFFRFRVQIKHDCYWGGGVYNKKKNTAVQIDKQKYIKQEEAKVWNFNAIPLPRQLAHHPFTYFSCYKNPVACRPRLSHRECRAAVSTAPGSAYLLTHASSCNCLPFCFLCLLTQLNILARCKLFMGVSLSYPPAEAGHAANRTTKHNPLVDEKEGEEATSGLRPIKHTKKKCSVTWVLIYFFLTFFLRLDCKAVSRRAITIHIRISVMNKEETSTPGVRHRNTKPPLRCTPGNDEYATCTFYLSTYFKNCFLDTRPTVHIRFLIITMYS